MCDQPSTGFEAAMLAVAMHSRVSSSVDLQDMQSTRKLWVIDEDTVMGGENPWLEWVSAPPFQPCIRVFDQFFYTLHSNPHWTAQRGRRMYQKKAGESDIRCLIDH